MRHCRHQRQLPPPLILPLIIFILEHCSEHDLGKGFIDGASRRDLAPNNLGLPSKSAVAGGDVIGAYCCLPVPLNPAGFLRELVGADGQMPEPAFGVAGRIDADVERQAAAVCFPGAQGGEEVLQRRLDQSVFPAACAEKKAIITTITFPGTIVSLEFQAKPQGADASPVAGSHGVELGDAWRGEPDAFEGVLLDYRRPVAGYRGEGSQAAAIVYQSLDDHESDLDGQVD